MVKVAIQYLDVEAAEYLNPRGDILSVRTADGRMLVFDRQKDPEIMFQIENTEGLKVLRFGQRAEEDEARIRAAVKKVLDEEKAAAEVKVETPVFNPVVTLNSENSAVATVSVEVPEVATPVMEMEVVAVQPEVDVETAEPQVEVKLTPVLEVKPDAVLQMVGTVPVESANVVVAVSAEDEAKLAEHNLTAGALAAEALAVAKPELPPKVEELVEVPVIQPVVPAAPDVPEVPQA